MSGAIIFIFIIFVVAGAFCYRRATAGKRLVSPPDAEVVFVPCYGCGNELMTIKGMEPTSCMRCWIDEQENGT